MYSKLFKFFEFLDVPSGIVLGTWSLVMIGLSVYSVIFNHPISSGLATCYCTVVATYGAHKSVIVWKGTSNQEDKNLDVQGDDNGSDK
jgi:hypothetical protein